jgi:hypothetical protein
MCLRAAFSERATTFITLPALCAGLLVSPGCCRPPQAPTTEIFVKNIGTETAAVELQIIKDWSSPDDSHTFGSYGYNVFPQTERSLDTQLKSDTFYRLVAYDPADVFKPDTHWVASTMIPLSVIREAQGKAVHVLINGDDFSINIGPVLDTDKDTDQKEGEPFNVPLAGSALSVFGWIMYWRRRQKAA